MTGFKLLIDTNVVIGLEDAQPVRASWAELVRLSNAYNVGLFVDGATYDDVSRDFDENRRTITHSKLEKFQRLRGLPTFDDAQLFARFGSIKSENDRSDVRLLTALDVMAVNFLVTEDLGIHQRADRAGISNNVMKVEEAVAWLRQTFQERSVKLPYLVELLAYELDITDPIFQSIRVDYPNFDAWFDKCRSEHRSCWALKIEDTTAGIVIRKEESHADARTLHPGPKILKVCTFKVRDEFLGEKFGELLLKQILWFAQRNAYDLIYLTAYPKHSFLIDLLRYYGFKETQQRNGELVLEKPLLKDTPATYSGSAFDFARLNYPRFDDRENVRKFCVPIRADYHRRLFPEIALLSELPLFPGREFGSTLIVDSRQERTPGNTIRKVYLCRAQSKQLRPGDLLFFYMSKDIQYAGSQSITTVGVIDQVNDATETEDLIRFTGKRSVYSVEELRGWEASDESPVKVIDFLLIGHIDPFITLHLLLKDGVFLNHPPQSITLLTPDRYRALRPHLRLAFES